MNRRRLAFSLIEMIVVFGLISVILGLTVVYIYNFKSGNALKISAHGIAAVLKQARSLAITKQTEFKVFFDIVNNEYQLLDSLNNEIEARKKPLADVILDRTTFDTDTIIFTATGGLSGGKGSVFIKNNKDQFHTLTVENTTGRIKIFSYEYTSG